MKPKDPSKLAAWRERERARSSARAALRKQARNALAGTPDIPEDHRLKGVSVLTDAAGALARRWDKSERDTTPEANKVQPPPDFAIDRVSRLTDSQGETRAQWTAYEAARVDRANALKKAFEEFVGNYSFKAPQILHIGSAASDHKVVVPIGDPHIGMLAHASEAGEHFDLKIAERELLAATDLVIQQAPPADTCDLVNLGDWFHAQTDEQRTPRGGNKVDVDGRREKIAEISLRMVERMTELALAKYKRVKFIWVPGNHDPDISTVWCMMLRRIFRDNPRVDIPSNLDPFIVEEFGQCMFLYNHTDKVKLQQLKDVMAGFFPEMWGRTKHRYIHGGHVHHSEVKEQLGVIAESHNTLAGSDAWHRAEGYGAKRLLKAIGYHKLYGEFARNTSSLERVRAFIKASRA